MSKEETTISSLEEKLNVSSDEEFENIINDMLSGTSTVINPSSGVIDTLDEDGSVIKSVDIDSSEENSDNVKVVADNINTDEAETDVTNEDDTEHSLEDEDEDDEVEVETVTDDVTDGEDYNQSIDNDDDDEIDYKEFYKKVTSGFDVNGLQVKSLDDPEKILDLQKQNLTSLNDLSELEAVKPIFESLKESGLLDDRDKFGLAMEVLGGNKEAIKKLLKEQNIDPYELDMDEIDESSIDSAKYSSSNEELNFKSFVSEATNIGVRNDIADKIINKWDDDSLVSLVNDEADRKNILKHIKTGMYDRVQSEILSIQNQDPSFSKMSDLEKYVVASNNIATRIKEKEDRVREIKRAATKDNGQTKVKTPKKINKAKKAVVNTELEEKARIEKAEVASKASTSPNAAPVQNQKMNLSDIEDDEEFMKAISLLSGY